jgi:hypothetical protein
MASRPPLAGFNHNIRYANRVYHVQTEDSGVDNPHVFTHVFLGGMIISSARTDYKDLASEEGHEERLRKLMQEQHKRLMKDLRRGGFDEKIVALMGSLEPAPEPALPEAGVEGEAPAIAGEVAGEAPVPAIAGEEAVPVPEPEAAPAELAPAELASPPEELAPPEPEASTVLEEPAAPPAPAVSASPAAALLEVATAERSDTDELPAVAKVQPAGGGLEAATTSELRAPDLPTESEPGPAGLEVEIQVEDDVAAPPAASPPPAESDLPVAISPARPTASRPTAPPARQPTAEPAPRAGVGPRRPRSDETIPWIPSEVTPPPVESRRAPTGAQVSARARTQPPASPLSPPQIEVKVSERPLEPGARPGSGLHVEVTERIDMRATLRAHAPGQPAGARARGVAPRVPGPLGPIETRRSRSDESPSVIVDRLPTDEGEETPLVTPTFYSQVRRAGAVADDPQRTQSIGMKAPTPEQPRSKVFGKPVPGAPTIPRPEDRTPVGPLEPRRSGVYPVPTLPVRPPHPDPIVRGGSERPMYGSTPQRYTAPSRMTTTPVTLPKRKSGTGTCERAGWSRPPGLPSASMVPPAAHPASRPPVAPRTPATGVPVAPRTPATGVPISPRTPATGVPVVPHMPATGAPIPPHTPPGGVPVVPRPGVTVRARTPVSGVPARPPVPPSRPPSVRTVAPRPPSGSSPVTRPALAQDPASRPRSPSGSGAVVARPAVIISAPVNVGEAPARAVRPAPPQRGAPAQQPRPPCAQTGAAPRAVKEDSVFGAGLITERSLDEVILSYLAEDVEPPDE